MTTFISYSRANSDFAVRLAKDLKAAGHDIFQLLHSAEPVQQVSPAAQEPDKAGFVPQIRVDPHAAPVRGLLERGEDVGEFSA